MKTTKVSKMSQRFWKLLLKQYVNIHIDNEYSCVGLCHTVFLMERRNLISSKTESKFKALLHNEFKDQTTFFTNNNAKTTDFKFIWRPDNKEVRINYIKSKIK